MRVKCSCTFCGSNNPGENIKNCVKRKFLQRISKEYTIGKNGNQIEDFLRKIEFDHIFSHYSTIPSNVYTELAKARGKQIFVHQIWRPRYATTLSQFQFNDMILEISYVNHQGDVEIDKISVTGKSLHSILCARNGATKISYLYDGTNRKTSECDNDATDYSTSEGGIDQENAFSQTDNQNNTRIDLIPNHVNTVYVGTILRIYNQSYGPEEQLATAHWS